MDRIFEFALASRKPWLLLMPQYVARKAFFLDWLNNRYEKHICGGEVESASRS